MTSPDPTPNPKPNDALELSEHVVPSRSDNKDVITQAVANALKGPSAAQLSEEIKQSSGLARTLPNVIYYPHLVQTLVQNIRCGGKSEKETGSGLRLQDPENLIVVFSDIDGTLTPSPSSSNETLRRGQDALDELTKFCKEYNILLIPISGSQYKVATSTTPSLQERMQRSILPSTFPLLIASGGKVAYGRNLENEFTDDIIYQSRIDSLEENFNEEDLKDRCTHYMRSINKGDKNARFGLSELSVSEDQIQTLKKIDIGNQLLQEHGKIERIWFQPHRTVVESNSLGRVKNGIHLYFYATSLEERDSIEEFFRTEFEKKGVAVVCCVERDYDDEVAHMIEAGGIGNASTLPRKYCLDITPYDKATALEYFVELINDSKKGLLGYGIANGLPSSHKKRKLECWFCGDSGNDLPAARSELISHVVMVGGSSRELIRHIDQIEVPGKKEVTFEGARYVAAESILHALKKRFTN